MRSLMILTLVSMVAIAALALARFGLSHAQAMGQNAGFIGSLMHHMNRNDRTDCDGNTSTHMNATQHMQGNMHDECEGIHDRMNMTRHIGDMH